MPKQLLVALIRPLVAVLFAQAAVHLTIGAANPELVEQTTHAVVDVLLWLGAGGWGVWAVRKAKTAEGE